MASHIRNEADMQTAVDALIAKVPAFSRCLEIMNGTYPPMRKGTPGFIGLAEIVTSQQISKAAANAILARLWQATGGEDLCPSQPRAEHFLALDEDAKRACGLSHSKIRYLVGIAEASIRGDIDPEYLEMLEDDQLIKTLTALPGLGRWSAEIYALFILGRTDVLPAADLALQESARRIFDLPERPSEKAFRAMAEDWRPHRSAAARLFWHSYRGAAIEGS